jgi:hypothetical protein
LLQQLSERYETSRPIFASGSSCSSVSPSDSRFLLCASCRAFAGMHAHFLSKSALPRNGRLPALLCSPVHICAHTQRPLSRTLTDLFAPADAAAMSEAGADAASSPAPHGAAPPLLPALFPLHAGARSTSASRASSTALPLADPFDVALMLCLLSVSASSGGDVRARLAALPAPALAACPCTTSTS